MANRRNIVDRLKAGEVLLMDGGTGSELQRRGVDVLKGATDRLKAWSATSNIEDADVVQQVHQDYLRVGADIIISNNFWTIPSAMERIGLRDRWKEYAGAAADNAIKARDAGNPEAYVAGGMAAPTLHARSESDASDVEQMGADAFREEYVEHAQLLAEAGADVILAEYVGYIEDCVAAVDACAESGSPVFLGVRHLQPDGTMQFDENLVDLAGALRGHPVDAVLIMCSNPEAASAGLPILRDAYDGPIGVYPNIGYNPTGPLVNRPQLTNQLRSAGPDILQTGLYPPARLAELAGEWKEAGAQIIGGCCATGPEHIMAMRPVVKGD
jgi:S-methylmethionine-dependent homocysteine/selenocysteine methylase